MAKPQLLRQPRRARVLQDVEALGDRLHHAVLDAVVDHLDEVAGAARPGVQVALLGARIAALAAGGGGDVALAGRQRREDRIEPVDDRLLAADHQAVAALEPPHAAGRADVEIVEALRLQLAGAADVVLPEGVAAVDDGVAGRRAAGQARRWPPRSPRPPAASPTPRAGRSSASTRSPTLAAAAAPSACQLPARRGVAVMDDAGVPVAHEPASDVGAHAAEAHDADLHGMSPAIA